MFCGRVARSRALWHYHSPRPSAIYTARFISVQSRLLAAKSDLFTLDLDFDTEDHPKGPSDGKTSEYSAQKAKDNLEDRRDLKSTDSIKSHGEKIDSTFNFSGISHSEANESAQLDDILADFVFEDPSEQKQGTSEIDALFSDLFADSTAATPSKDFSFEEDLGQFDPDSFDTPESAREPKNYNKASRVIADEKELFEKIFATYSQTEDSSASSDKMQSSMLSSLQGSIFAADKPMETAPIGSVTETLSERESTVIERKTIEALAQTSEFIKDLPTREAVVDFARKILKACSEEASNKQSFYLHKLKGESSKSFLTRHTRLCRKTRLQSEEQPENPRLTVFTMPVIFNRVIQVLTTKFYDGSLALSLFNSVKEDLNLYTIVCNQRTYNEILKVHWVFFGKRSLCEIELIVVEMMNNGFVGDKHTFAILKEMLSTYYAMKAGQSKYNPGGLPIWSKEDEKRARNLSSKLRTLGRQLQRERFFNASTRDRSSGKKRIEADV